MTTQPHIAHEYIDEPFREVVAYTLDHRELVLEIKVTPDPEQPPHVVIVDESTKCRYEPRYEKTVALGSATKAYHYERTCVEASEDYTYWLRLIIIDSTALVPHPEQFVNPDYIAERREHWTIISRLEQVREVPMSTLPIRKQRERDTL
jgi:hypothetical protein